MVLHGMHSIEEPSSLFAVHSQCSDLEKLLSISLGSISRTGYEPLAACFDPLLRLCCAYELNLQNLILVLDDVYAWCKRYNLRTTARLVREKFPEFLVADKDREPSAYARIFALRLGQADEREHFGGHCEQFIVRSLSFDDIV
jgi:hypothetical protein